MRLFVSQTLNLLQKLTGLPQQKAGGRAKEVLQVHGQSNGFPSRHLAYLCNPTP